MGTAENLLGQPACSYGNLPGYWAQKPNSTVGTWTVLDDRCQLQVDIYQACAPHLHQDDAT